MGLIKIDIKETKRKAGQIEDLSETVKNISANKIDDACSNISAVWTGEGSNRYRKKLNKINSKLRKRGNNLKSIGSGLRGSANRLEKIESAAKSLFS